MSTFSLDQIREAAEQKYGATVIELGDGQEARLLNPIRLSSDKRKALMKVQSQIESLQTDEEVSDEAASELADKQLALLADAIRAVAETPFQAELLLDKVGSDGAMLITVFELYNKAEAPGEA